MQKIDLTHVMRKFPLWWAAFQSRLFPDGWEESDMDRTEWVFWNGYAAVVNWRYIHETKEPPIGTVMFLAVAPLGKSHPTKTIRGMLESRHNGRFAAVDSAGFPVYGWEPYAWAPHPMPSDFLPPDYQPQSHLQLVTTEKIAEDAQ